MCLRSMFGSSHVGFSDGALRDTIHIDHCVMASVLFDVLASLASSGQPSSAMESLAHHVRSSLRAGRMEQALPLAPRGDALAAQKEALVEARMSLRAPGASVGIDPREARRPWAGPREAVEGLSPRARALGIRAPRALAVRSSGDAWALADAPSLCAPSRPQAPQALAEDRVAPTRRASLLRWAQAQVAGSGILPSWPSGSRH